MTYEEAIKVIEINRPTSGYTMLCEALDMAKEVLEKQMPKKPIRANRAIEIDGQLVMIDENEYWKCPMCTLYDVPLRENQKYCHYCGQAIDWSKNNDL